MSENLIVWGHHEHMVLGISLPVSSTIALLETRVGKITSLEAVPSARSLNVWASDDFITPLGAYTAKTLCCVKSKSTSSFLTP